MTDVFFDGYGTWYRKYSDVTGEIESIKSVACLRMVGVFRLSEDDEIALKYSQSLDNCEWLYPSQHADDRLKKWLKTMREYEWEMWLEENFSHPSSEDWAWESQRYHFLDGYVFKIDMTRKRLIMLETNKSILVESTDNNDNQVENIRGGEEKPWDKINPNDPTPEQPWYTPARYFARQLVINDSTLLNKRDNLARKVVQSLDNVGIKKRGGKKPFDPNTVKKALSNVKFN